MALIILFSWSIVVVVGEAVRDDLAEAALTCIIIHSHWGSVACRHLRVLLQVRKHLIWHLRHATIHGAAHGHVRHHAGYHELIIVHSVHQAIRGKLHWIITVRGGGTTLTGGVILEHLLELYLHALSVDHLGKSLQLL